MPNGRDGPLRGSESAKAGAPPAALPGAGLGPVELGSPACARFGVAARAVWPVSRAGTRGLRGLDLGPRAHFDQRVT
eukprot:15067032-Alexandrium_andersonii.AAC.1